MDSGAGPPAGGTPIPPRPFNRLVAAAWPGIRVNRLTPLTERYTLPTMAFVSTSETRPNGDTRPPPIGIFSPSLFPPFHIALEEHLRQSVRAPDHHDFFLCSRNGPSVIVGRNQDALAEVSPQARQTGVNVYRRTSGGGAVYHDEGNLNWSWIVAGGLPDRERLLSTILRILRDLGIDAQSGPRSGLYVDGRKIGGTAAAAGNGVLLFHGTLLISTDLDQLQSSLAAHTPTYAIHDAATRKGVPSVPSRQLTTLAHLHPGLDVTTLQTSLFTAIVQDGVPRPPGHVADLDVVTALADEYSRNSWIFHRQPPTRTLRGTS